MACRMSIAVVFWIVWCVEEFRVVLHRLRLGQPVAEESAPVLRCIAEGDIEYPIASQLSVERLAPRPQEIRQVRPAGQRPSRPRRYSRLVDVLAHGLLDMWIFQINIHADFRR